MLDSSELKRYSRHIIMPEVGLKGQEKLKQAKVLVIGAGGLGCPVLQYLTASGVGTIGILDYDKVSVSNLHRQILYTDDDLGKPKTEIASKKLKKLNPFVNFQIHNVKLTKENALEIISEYEIIIDGSDNFSTRFLVNDACIILNKPLVFGAIYKFMGQVSVFNYKNGPTYRCLFPEQPVDNEIPNCSTIGVIGVIPGIIGTMQASETIKIIIENGDVLSGKLFQIDALSFKTDVISFEKDTESPEIKELGEYGDFCELDSENGINEIHVEDLKQRLENKEDLIIYDVRSKQEYTSHNIGGILISVDDLFNQPELIQKDKTVVIMCEIGVKSSAVVEYFQKVRNPDNVFNLKGGIQEWISKGYKVERE